MKKIYWRPSRVPRTILVVIAIMAMAGMAGVETLKVSKRQPYYSKKIKAAQKMKEGMEAIKQYRIKRFGPLNTDADPAGTGMIGLASSLITSNIGYLRAKQTSANPNWAAVLVHLLKRAGVKENDVIAVGYSGSFPSINLAVVTAAEALGLKIIGITSVSASTWGANIPELTWLDMERVLIEKKIISHKSAAASIGGDADKAVGMSKKSLYLLNDAIKRNKVRLIQEEKVRGSIDARMAVYEELAEGGPIAVYVNVGGSKVSVGSKYIKRIFQTGLNRKPSPKALRADSVMARFAREGVPLIHMLFIPDMAEKFGLPVGPETPPEVGEGDVYEKLMYNLYLAGGVFAGLIIILYIFLKSDIGYRIFGSSRVTQTPKHPAPMV